MDYMARREGSFLLGNVCSLKGSLTTCHVVHVVILVKVLTREDQSGGTFLSGDGGNHSGNGLLSISGTVDIELGDDTETRNGLNGLVRRTILTDTNRVVSEKRGGN